MAIGREFSLPDYIVFSVTIAISLGIGVYSAFTGGRQRTTEEFLVGDRNLKVIPVTLSLIVSFESSIMMLGLPAEMYTFGIQYWWTPLTLAFSMVIIALLMVPTFFDMKIVSAYEYLEARFESRLVRLIGSFLGGMMNLWYMGIVLYGPSIALQAVTGFDIWSSILVIASVSTIYTTLGGIKAVIWADAFQSLIMLGGMLAVIIKGTMAVGGVRKVYDINNKGGRMEFFNFDFDPTVRLTFWGVTIGNLIRNLSTGINQTSVQRISTMPTKRKAQLITVLSGPGFFLFGFLALMEGVVAYAYFVNIGCDPLEAGIIEDTNQIMPYFVMELFHTLPGLPGLFLAALFSASLSTLSSGYASISAIIWSDFIKPFTPNYSQFKDTLIIKLLVVASALLSVGVAILVIQVGGPMNQIYGTLIPAFAGPLTGLFILGGLVPQANAKGAIIAVVVSCTFGLWKGMGTAFLPDVIKTPYLPGGSTANCSVFGNLSVALSNFTSTMSTTTLNTTVPLNKSLLDDFYSISFIWISPIAMAITVIVGIVASYATGGRKKGSIDSQYLMLFCERLCCCLPDRVRSLCRFDDSDYKKTDSLYMHEVHDDAHEKMLSVDS